MKLLQATKTNRAANPTQNFHCKDKHNTNGQISEERHPIKERQNWRPYAYEIVKRGIKSDIDCKFEDMYN